MSWETMANVVIAFRRNWGIFCEEGCMVCEIGEERAATPLTPRPSFLKSFATMTCCLGLPVAL
jgi:hypothetical protein